MRQSSAMIWRKSPSILWVFVIFLVFQCHCAEAISCYYCDTFVNTNVGCMAPFNYNGGKEDVTIIDCTSAYDYPDYPVPATSCVTLQTLHNNKTRYLRGCNANDSITAGCQIDSPVEWECYEICTTDLCNTQAGASPTATLPPDLVHTTECYFCDSTLSLDNSCTYPINPDSEFVFTITCDLVDPTVSCYTAVANVYGSMTYLRGCNYNSTVTAGCQVNNALLWQCITLCDTHLCNTDPGGTPQNPSGTTQASGSGNGRGAGSGGVSTTPNYDYNYLTDPPGGSGGRPVGGNGATPIQCYSCSNYDLSSNNGCGEPFDVSSPAVLISGCEETADYVTTSCFTQVSYVKGGTTYLRGCNTNNEYIHAGCNTVANGVYACITVCNSFLCNTGHVIRPQVVPVLVTMVLSLIAGARQIKL